MFEYFSVAFWIIAMTQCKSQEIKIGSLNAKIKNEKDGEIVGMFGLGTSQERVEKWLQRLQVVVNTWFQEFSRPLYRWKNPRGETKYQFDYRRFNKGFMKAVLYGKIYL